MFTIYPGTSTFSLISYFYFFFFFFFLCCSSIEAIDYSSLRDDAFPVVEHGEISTVRLLYEELNGTTLKDSYSLQESTEYLLDYGALLRTRVAKTFGRLLYEHYDDFGINEVESLFKVYQETLERKYNIFDIVPSVLEDLDTRPSSICNYIHNNANACLKGSSRICRSISKHDVPYAETLFAPALNFSRQIYRRFKIVDEYPAGFSLAAILNHLQRGALHFSPALFSGLLHNVRYENLDHQARKSEKELARHFGSRTNAKDEGTELMPAPPTPEELKTARSVGSLLKRYLSTRKTRFPFAIQRNAEVLAGKIVGDVNMVNENIQLLGNVYNNGIIRVRYLFGLVLPDDNVDADIRDARDYLVGKMEELQRLDRHLEVDKYQQTSPDQIVLDIIGQLEEINFATDISRSLQVHAEYWHRSRMIETLNDLLKLFDAYENLRRLPEHESMMGAIDEIKENLWDSKLITMEILCNSPRHCLQLGLELVLKCKHLNENTRESILRFLSFTTPKGSLKETDCSLPTSEAEVLETEADYSAIASSQEEPDIDERTFGGSLVVPNDSDEDSSDDSYADEDSSEEYNDEAKASSLSQIVPSNLQKESFDVTLKSIVDTSTNGSTVSIGSEKRDESLDTVELKKNLAEDRTTFPPENVSNATSLSLSILDEDPEVSTTSSLICDNKDPYYHKSLDRLERLKRISTLRSTRSISKRNPIFIIDAPKRKS